MGLAVLILLFHWKLLDLQIGFYSGDHRQQHYPWAFFYAKQLNQGVLPWWTSLFGCGFPLLAEGQVGALYLPNFLFYKFFPFDFAYTYNILFHYVLGAGFFYLLVRSRGISKFAAFLGCLIYLFGTAQGGYYYNIISLKTLIWFPLSLYFIFRIFESQKYRLLFWLALVFAFQFCAGYLQYAVYSVAFCGFTCLWFAILKIQVGKVKDAMSGLAVAFAAVVLGVLCAMPQLGATWELSRFSNRFDFPIEFAFVGSFNPLAAATLFFPHWDGFLRAELYFGALGLLFLMHAFRRFKLEGRSYFIFGFVMALSLALGGFNPFYRWGVEWTGFSSFRVPTKFLYFAGFYGAVICAYGAHAWMLQDQRKNQKTWRLWSFFSFVGILGLAACHYFFQILKVPVLTYAEKYIQTHYAGSPIRPHTMEVYHQKLSGLYDAILLATFPLEIKNLIFVFFILISWSAVTFLVLRRINGKLFFCVVFSILFVNLWTFGDTSIRGSYEKKEFLLPSSEVTGFLKNQPSDGRLHRAFRTITDAVNFPILPHNNILIGRPLVGMYSPLVMKSFYDRLSAMGDVDDSNSLRVSSREKFLESSELLDFLNVEWILSDHLFSFDRYQKVAESESTYLYRNLNVKPRVTVQNGAGEVISFNDKQDSLSVHLKTISSAELVVSDVFYPGWIATLNGATLDIRKYRGLFKSVQIPSEGEWFVEMKYQPVWRKWVAPCICLAVILLFFPVLLRRRYDA